MVDPKGNLQTIVCVYTDITKQREQELKITAMMDEARANAELLTASAAELQTALSKIASGDLTYRVVRSNAGDPAFPLAGITTSNPDGGTAGTQFTDVGELANSTTRYYLVRNRQVTE